MSPLNHNFVRCVVLHFMRRDSEVSRHRIGLGEGVGRPQADRQTKHPFCQRRSAIGREKSALPRDVNADVSGLDLIEHPPLVLRVVRVFLTKIIPNDLSRSVLVDIAEFPSEFGRFICSHNFECWP